MEFVSKGMSLPSGSGLQYADVHTATFSTHKAGGGGGVPCARAGVKQSLPSNLRRRTKHIESEC